MRNVFLFCCLFAGCVSTWDAEESPDGQFQASAVVTDEGITVFVLNRSKQDMLICVSDDKRNPPRSYSVSWMGKEHGAYPLTKLIVRDAGDFHLRPLSASAPQQSSFTDDQLYTFTVPFPDNFRHLESFSFTLLGSCWSDLAASQGYRSFIAGRKAYRVQAEIRDERPGFKRIRDMLQKTVLPARTFEGERLSTVLVTEYETSCSKVGKDLFRVLISSPSRETSTRNPPPPRGYGYLEIMTYAALYGNDDDDPVVTLSIPSLPIDETFRWIAEHTGLTVSYHADTIFLSRQLVKPVQ